MTEDVKLGSRQARTEMVDRSDGVRCWAELSPDRRYRWFLQRSWGMPLRYAPPGSGMVLWIGLNPSTADAERDDATIRRMLGFSQRWGFVHMCVCNLFARRATRQQELWATQPGVEPYNLELIGQVAASAAVVVACWGAPPPSRVAAAQHRLAADAVAHVVTGEGRSLYCLGRTRGGHPRHPVRLAADTPLELWRHEAL